MFERSRTRCHRVFQDVRRRRNRSIIRRGLWRRPSIELLERRELLALTSIGIETPTWTAVGPAPSNNGGVEGIPNQPIAGAVRAIAVQPDKGGTSANESKIVYVGTANGGVWRTLDIDAASVDWEPLTDKLPSSAIGAISISPVDQNVVYAGTGKFSSFYSSGTEPVGLYRTIDGNTSGAPTWEHLTSMKMVGASDTSITNVFAGLPISSIALSPLDKNVLLVGTTSSETEGNRLGNVPAGLFRSTDGGATWTRISGTINAPDGVNNDGDNETDEADERNANDLVNNDGDAEIDEADELNFPTTTVYDLAWVPGTSTVFASTGDYPYLYRSNDSGKTWENVGMQNGIKGIPISQILTPVDVAAEENVRFAVHSKMNTTTNVRTTVIYAGIVIDDKLVKVFRTDNLDTTKPLGDQWLAVDDLPNVHPGKQGGKHFSIAVDPDDPKLLFVGGDRPASSSENGCTGFRSNVQRATFSGGSTPNATWDKLYCNGNSGTAPHSDSRDMEFIPGHPNQMLEADDGGIYLLDRANAASNAVADSQRKWLSKNGDLQISEIVRVAYDSTNNIFFAGLQDNGIVTQTAATSNVWTQNDGGDGTYVAADPSNPSIHYTIANNFFTFSKFTYTSVSSNTRHDPPLFDLGDYDEYLASQRRAVDIPFVFNRQMFSGETFNRLLIGYYDLHESSDGGDHLTVIENLPATGLRRKPITAIAAGAIDNPIVAYVARGRNIAVRRPNSPSSWSPSVINGETAVCGPASSTATFAESGIGFSVLSGTIYDIAINPHNWMDAYAVGGDASVWRTLDGGDCWFPITVGLGLSVRAVEIVDPDVAVVGDEVLMVGTNKGIYRAITKPDGSIDSFVAFGKDFPTVLVNDLNYDATDDILYVGTLGRGVWKMDSAKSKLESQKIFNGTNAIENITITYNTSQKKLLIKDGTNTFQLNPETIDSITINGNGGNDTLTIDNAMGFIGNFGARSKPLTIVFNAGEDPPGNADIDNLIFKNTTAQGEAITLRSKNIVGEAGEFNLSSNKSPRAIKIVYSQVENVPTPPIPLTVAAVGSGLQNVSDALASAGSGADSGVGPMVAKLVNAERAGEAGELNRTFDPVGAASIDLRSFASAPASPTAFLRRILEFGANAFRLSDIGTLIATSQELRTSLDALDNVPDNVTLAQLTDAQGNVTQTKFDVQIDKTLFGTVKLDNVALNGTIIVNASADLFADAHVHIVFGVDSQGFFVDPNPTDSSGSPIGPEIQIRNVRGTLAGTGRIGIVDVNIDNGVLTSDPDVGLSIDIVLPPVSPGVDGLIRDEEWYERGIQELTDVELVSDPGDGVNDISISADFTVSLFSSASLPTFGLNLAFPDASDLNTVIPTPKSGETIAKVLDFLNANSDSIVTGIRTIAAAIEQSTGTDTLNKKIPLINKTLGEVLDSAPVPLDIANSNISGINPGVTDGGNTRVKIFISSLNLAELGIEVENTVDYVSATSGLSTSASIVEVTSNSISVEFPVGVGSLPAAAPNLKIHRSGNLESQLRSLLNGVPIQIPSLQDLVQNLERATGFELFSTIQFVGTIGQPDFAIQIPLTFDPKPRTFRLPIDLSTKADGLSFDASGTVEVIVDPKFELTVGVRLAKNGTDGNPLSVFDRIYVVASTDPTPSATGVQPTGKPLASLDVTVRLNDPQIQGSVGFLDVTLSEDRANGAPVDNPTTPIDEDGNKGIQASLLARFDLKDADTDPNDQRITLQNLVTKPLDVLAFDLDGSIDIDGLKLNASIGGSSGLSLATVKISLDGESSATAPGHINTFSDLATAFSNIQVTANFDAMQTFRNISAADVLAALDLLVTKLQATGHGDVFSKPIPIVNRSVADLIDLGQVFLDTIGKPNNDSSTATAGKLQAFINSKLAEKGLPANVEIILKPDAVRLKFAVSKSYTKFVPLAFQVGGSGLSIDGNANLGLTAKGTLNLTFGILTAPGLTLVDRFFLDTDNVAPAVASGIDVRLEANVGYVTANQPTALTPLELDVVLGPIGFHVKDGRILVGLNVGANLTTSDSSKRITLNNLGSVSIKPTFNGSVQAVIPIDGDNSGGTVGSRLNTLTGDDALILVAGKFTILSSLSPTFATSSTLVLPAGLTTPIADGDLPTQLRIEGIKVVELINKQFLNFGTLIEGLDRLLEWGDQALNLDILNRKIPFIGKSVHDGLNFLESDQPGAKTLRTVIQALVANGGDGLKANASNAAVDAALSVLRNALANIKNVVPVSDFNSDGVVNALDLIVPTKNGDETTGVLVRFKYNPTFTTNRPFDLGIDFLNLNGTGNVALNGSLELNIGFGITKTEGFFFITDMPQPEFKIGGSIMPSLTLGAKLGRLDVDLAIASGSYASIDFSMNIVDPSGDGKLTLSELTNFSQTSSIIPSNNLQLNVETHLVGTFATKLDRNNQLPSFSADVNVDWRVADVLQPDGFRGIDLLHLSSLPTAQKTPQVKIVNVVLDVGSFVTSIVKPIFQKITESGLIPPSLKTALDTEIPLLKRKVKDLLRETIVLNPDLMAAQKESRLRVFDLLLNITTFLSNAESLVSQTNDDSLKINFGDINVGVSSSDPTIPAPTPTLTDATVTVTQKGTTKPQDPAQPGVTFPGSRIPLIKDFLKKLGEMGITFPVLRLSNLVQLIVGNDTDIVLIDLPEFKIEKTFNQSFPLIGGGIGDIVSLQVAAFLGGGFTFTAHLAGGFDTSGLRKGRFVDGFYLGDFDPNSTGSANGQIDPVDKERPEISFTGFVQAGIVGEAEILGFDVGKIEGYFKITAQVNVDLNDDNEINGVAPPCDTRTVAERHDGKLHFSEIPAIRLSHGGEFLSILELDGGLFAELGLHITVLGGLLYDKQFSKRFDLLTFDNFTFPVNCPPSGSDGGSCSSTGSNGNNLATPILNNSGLFDISIPPQGLADPQDDPLLAIAEDFNGNPYDGGGINTYDPSEFAISSAIDGFDFSSTLSSTDLIDQGMQIGQGVTFMQNGVEIGGVVTAVAAHGFTVRNYAGPRPAALPRALFRNNPISVYSPNETLVLQRHGTVETFGPTSCGENNLPNGTSSVGGIQTQDDNVGLGAGNNSFQAHPSVRLPIKILGGLGNDTIIGGSGPIIAIGGPGNDTIQVGTFIGAGVAPGANIKGGSGRDSIFGGRGSDILLGEEGDDLIFDDVATFSTSSPTGNDKVVGGGGKDTIVSRGGLDELTGDYHEELDRRPTSTNDQKEGADIIRHESTDKATIFGDNRGATASSPGVKPNSSQNTENSILSRGTDDETFSNTGDKFEPNVSKGIIRITESLTNPTVRSSSMTATGLKQLAVATNNTIEITDATGVLNIVAESVGTTATVSAITNGLKVVFAGGPIYNVRGISGLTLTGAGGSDQLILDFVDGNPIPIGGASFVGQASTRTIGDQIRIVGTGTEILTTPVRGAQSGSFSIASRSLKFSNVKSVETSKLSTFSWQTAKSTDSYSVQAAVGTGGVPAAQIVGNSNGSVATNWIFFDIPTVTLDAGIGDSATTNDIVGVNTNGLLARGLSNLKILTGDGNDIISVIGNSLNLASTVNRLTIDGGVGLDQFNIGGDTDFSLNGDTNALTSPMIGSVSLIGLGSDNIRLVGGSSGNRFILNNWPGNVTLDGAAGIDFLTLTMRGGSVTTVDELTLSTNVIVNLGATATIGGTLNMGSATRTFNIADGSSVQDLIVNALLTGTVGLTKTGAGTMTLIQDNTITGVFTVSAGVLLVDGQQTNAITLNGGTLGGKGQAGTVTGSTGTLSPGSNFGILTSRSVVLTSANNFQAELNGTTPGKNQDVLSVVGTVNLGGSVLSTTVGFSSVPGNTYRILDNDGSDLIVGTFAGKGEGSTFVASGFTFQISYRGGTGNDVVLTHLSNSAPAFQNRTVTPTIDENGVVTITGLITEPDVGDLFTLVVDWGDENTQEEFQFDPAQGRDVKVQHQYKDDPSDQPLDQRIISLLWRDQHGASNVGNLTTTVLNVAPSVAARPENTSAGTHLKAKGQFTDPGIDSWFATVDYGTGQGEQALPLSPTGTFTFDYQYDQSGLYTVKVRVTDDDGGVGESTFPVRVEVDSDGRLYLLSWRNRRLNVDVDADGSVGPLDVLAIINEINRGPTSNDLLSRLIEFDLANPVYFDTTGDDYLSPLDVLLVINYINNQSSASAGEGEAVFGYSQSPIYSVLSPLFSSPSNYAASIPTSSILSMTHVQQVFSDYEDDSFDVDLFAVAIADNVRRDTRDLDELLDDISCDLAEALKPVHRGLSRR